MKQGIEMTHAVEDQLALIPEERTSELGRIIEKNVGRAIETTPVAALDTGKGQGNRSLDAYSWRLSQAPYCEGRGRERKIACDQPERPNGKRSVP